MINQERYKRILDKMNQFNAGEKGITRVAYTKEEQACTHTFMRMCMAQKLKVRIDSCGNLIARREGRVRGLPPVVIGSHLDTVYQGGKYDGVVGVTAGLEIVTRLNEKGIMTEHPIEIISFACEESSRFGVSTIGSKAIAGLFDEDKYRHLKDRNGISIERAFSLCGLSYHDIHLASRANETFKAFFELHIEQGPVLEKENKKIGIVTGVAAPNRLVVNVIGKASHSGTTPMSMRNDALLGASEMVLEIEKAAKCEEPYGTVATVGVLDVLMGAMNVVPGEVEMKIDIRSTSTESRQRVVNHLHQTISDIEKSRKLEFKIQEISKEEPILLSTELIQSLKEICDNKQLPYVSMQSGAGHDAMNMARICPTGLVFIPSKDGLSHHPLEYSELDDILKGIDVLEAAVLQQAKVIKEGGLH